MTGARAVDVIALVALGAASVLAALLELFLVPLYAGATLVPITVLFAVALNIVLPRMARSVIPTTAVTASPFVLWLLVVVGVGMFPRPEGDVVLPGGGGGVQWTSYGVLLGGAVAGTVTIVLSGARSTVYPRPAMVAASAPAGASATTRPIEPGPASEPASEPDSPA